MRIFGLLLILAAMMSRVAALYVPVLGNISPLMALTFCGGVYFRNRWLWLVPFVALAVSDIWVDLYYQAHYHYAYTWRGTAMRLLCFAAGLLLGRMVAARRTWVTLLGGALASSFIFYFVTNTASWLGDMAYAHDAAGWWQAMTVGHPEFLSTFYFFRNTLVSDLVFTGLFVLAMESAALRAGEKSLLRRPVAI